MLQRCARCLHTSSLLHFRSRRGGVRVPSSPTPGADSPWHVEAGVAPDEVWARPPVRGAAAPIATAGGRVRRRAVLRAPAGGVGVRAPVELRAGGGAGEDGGSGGGGECDDLTGAYGPDVDAGDVASTEGQELAEQMDFLCSGALQRVDVEALRGGGDEYAPVAPGVPWLRLPIAERGGLLLPVPAAPRASAWAWEAWAGKGELLSMDTMTHVLAPVPPELRRFSGGARQPAAPAPAVLSQLSELIARYSGGSGGGGGSRRRARGGGGGAGGGPPLPQPPPPPPPPTEESLLDPLRLPVCVTLRVTRGLVASELGPSLGNSPARVAQLMMDLHALRTGPGGDAREAKETQPLAVLHSWATTAADGRALHGIEYEAPSDLLPLGPGGARPPWGRLTPEQALAGGDSEAARRYRAEEYARARASGLGARAPPSRVLQRHAVAWIFDGAADAVVEVTLSAPAEGWDDLWEGGAGEGGGTGAGRGWPCAEEVGLQGVGLKRVFEHATLM